MKVIGNIGDVNPLQYGAWIVLEPSEKYVDCIVIEPIDWEGNGKQGESIDCLTYSVALDRFKLMSVISTRETVLTDYGWNNTWHWEPSGEWFDSPEFRRNIDDSGIGWDEFVTAICDESPVKRAWAHREIAQYYGIANYDDSPSRETEPALKKRFALPFYWARKRGVTVYA